MYNPRRAAFLAAHHLLTATPPVPEKSTEDVPVEFTEGYEYSGARYRAFVDAFREQGVATTDRQLSRLCGIPRTKIRKIYEKPSIGIFQSQWTSIKALAKKYRIEIGGKHVP